jgi:hypothetical protein
VDLSWLNHVLSWKLLEPCTGIDTIWFRLRLDVDIEGLGIELSSPREGGRTGATRLADGGRSGVALLGWGIREDRQEWRMGERFQRIRMGFARYWVGGDLHWWMPGWYWSQFPIPNSIAPKQRYSKPSIPIPNSEPEYRLPNTVLGKCMHRFFPGNEQLFFFTF